MGDTIGVILLAAVLLFLLGPIFVAMLTDAVTAAWQMWRDLFRRTEGSE